MNKNQHDKAASAATGRRCQGSGPWAVLCEGSKTGIRQFGPAIRLLLVTILGALALMLLGMDMIYAPSELGPTAQRFMTLAGEGLLLLSGVAMLAGCVLAWGRVSRVADVQSNR